MALLLFHLVEVFIVQRLIVLKSIPAINRSSLNRAGNFIAGHPKAAFLFCFFGDFKCGALLFVVILVIYKFV